MFKGICRSIEVCLLALVCFTVIGSRTLLAQGTRSTITGVVADASGAVVPNASVAVTNQATNVKYPLKTNSSGVYFVTSLLPGTYTVEVAAKGFRTYVDRNVEVTTDLTVRVDVSLEVGAETQEITVEAGAPLVSTEEGRLSQLVTASQVQNMPLNGRNIYELMQLVPGAVNSTAVNYEQNNGGIQTNINGTRANFNGFLLDGMANKGLSGGSNSQPAPDFVQEFRIQTNNFDASYGNSAGTITDVSVKSGSNSLHGNAWEYDRNTSLNARNFFEGSTRTPWHMNQFGATIGGPIKRDKMFFFGGYEGERFRTSAPAQFLFETGAFRQAVASALPNSVSNLLFSNFAGKEPNSQLTTVDSLTATNAVNELGVSGFGPGNEYAADANGNPAGILLNGETAYIDPCFASAFNGVGSPSRSGGPNWGDPQALANNLVALLGVTQQEHDQIVQNIATVDGCAGLVAPAVNLAALSNRGLNAEGLVNATIPTRTSGVFYNGDQYTARLDYQGDKNRIFGRYYFFLKKDPNVTTGAGSAAIRGFPTPFSSSFPGAAISYIHNFGATTINEVLLGFTRNQLGDTPAPKLFGVPEVDFDTGETSFGSYNGYPQFFNEDVFNFKDMVTTVRGKHSLKFGGEFKRNYENSEFNVGRADYSFFDLFYFSADLPYDESTGVNPEIVSGSRLGHQDTNIRAWRNYEESYFAQDDWKVKKNLTLNLGLRWDYFSPHTEKYGHATFFQFGPGSDANSRLASINCRTLFDTGPGGASCNGGFGSRGHNGLFPPDRNNFSPRFGFAWDPFGNQKTSIRGSFAVFFESTFYNSLSNSRWNLPFYSFNEADPVVLAIPGTVVYGPTVINADGTAGGPDYQLTGGGTAPTYSGQPVNPGPGPFGAGFQGNIQGWDPGSPNLASLTGVPDPTTRSPYYENGFFGFQQEITPSTVLEVNWVGTFGHKLMWAENINRVVGGLNRPKFSVQNPCALDPLTGLPVLVKRTGTINPCFGRIRTWKNSVNSDYESLQASLNKKMSRGIAFTSSYTWSHALDYRSSWHSLSSGGSATEADPRGGSGYSLDPNRLYLEHASSLFDIRHRFVSSIQWELPWMQGQKGLEGHVLGGWQLNTSFALQTGFPFTVGANKDFNRDGIRNDRPDIPSFGNSLNLSPRSFELGSGPDGVLGLFQSLGPGGTATCAAAVCFGAFPKPASGADGTLGRNTFRGPGFANVDFSVFKKIAITERWNLQFRAEFFNLFNRTNLYQPQSDLAQTATWGLSDTAFDPRQVQLSLKLFF